jgi:hypothetical protein
MLFAALVVLQFSPFVMWVWIGSKDEKNVSQFDAFEAIHHTRELEQRARQQRMRVKRG